jgi:MFS family permease
MPHEAIELGAVAPKEGTARSPYAYYVLGVLCLISVLNYYDRNVISIILQPMKRALHLTDTEAGLLSGLAFAVVYSLLGVPIARFADRGHRVPVLSTALALWSVMTAACGFAGNVVSMFVARMGVGVGEAGGLPTTHALVAEYFQPERRSSALSVIAIASSFGAVLGLAVGGVVADRYGWRAAFWVGGPPGLALALLAWLTIKEPSRRGGPEVVVTGATVPLGQAIAMLMRRRAFIYVVLGMMIASIAAYAQQAWSPTFFIRSFGMTPGRIGPLFSVLTGVPSIVGMLFGGVIVDRWTKRDRRAPVWIVLLTFGVSIPLSLIVFLTPNLNVALGVSAFGALIGSVYIGPNYALIQGLAGPKIRATAAAIYMMIINILGLSLGPAVAGMISDALTKVAGEESLRWSLIVTLVFYLVSLPLFALAARTVRADLDDAERT